jgi:hypothetical protein
MSEILEFSVENLVPEVEEILANQGVPEDKVPDEKVIETAEEAVGLFEELCDPAGIIEEISRDDFSDVYYGEGHNDENDPVARIYPRADFMALFAVTVGQELSDKIESLFELNDFALASMLDAAASEGVERTGILAEAAFRNELKSGKGMFQETASLRYSPGYCGWHISGQGKLFEYLEPENIGISLTESYLMQPLKSISGVIIVGRPEIHQFEIGFPFCENCATHDCQVRMQSVINDS